MRGLADHVPLRMGLDVAAEAVPAESVDDLGKAALTDSFVLVLSPFPGVPIGSRGAYELRTKT